MTVRFELAGHIATVTLNRPERRNALTMQSYAELSESFHKATADPEVRCVIVTGADPAFCSGDDMKEIMIGPHAAARRAAIATPTHPANRTAMAILNCDKPVIAAVNGAAIGWGMELALFADIRIASEHAKFGELFVKRGLVPDVGGFTRLPAIVGPAMAAELLFTGDVIDATEAQRIGLVRNVAPHDQLMEEARALAQRIVVNPPLAVGHIKKGLRLTVGALGTTEAMGAWASETIFRLMETEDHQEGVRSFFEKRAPVFRGR